MLFPDRAEKRNNGNSICLGSGVGQLGFRCWGKGFDWFYMYVAADKTIKEGFMRGINDL